MDIVGNLIRVCFNKIDGFKPNDKNESNVKNETEYEIANILCD